MDINKIESLAAYLKALGKKDVSALSNEEVADWVMAGKAGVSNKVALQAVTDPGCVSLCNKRKRDECFTLLRVAIKEGKSVIFRIGYNEPLSVDDDSPSPFCDDDGRPKFFIE